MNYDLEHIDFVVDVLQEIKVKEFILDEFIRKCREMDVEILEEINLKSYEFINLSDSELEKKYAESIFALEDMREDNFKELRDALFLKRENSLLLDEKISEFDIFNMSSFVFNLYMMNCFVKVDKYIYLFVLGKLNSNIFDLLIEIISYFEVYLMFKNIYFMTLDNDKIIVDDSISDIKIIIDNLMSMYHSESLEYDDVVSYLLSIFDLNNNFIKGRH